jgi:hypothetical protein
MSDINGTSIDDDSLDGLIPREVLDTLRAKYTSDELRVLVARDGEVVTVIRVRNVGPQYTAWKVAIFEDKRRPFAAEEYFKSVCVYPPKPQLLKIFDELPFLMDRLSTEAMELAGAGGDVDAKKV